MIYLMFYTFLLFIFVSTCLCSYNTMVSTPAHALKALFSKPLSKLHVSSYFRSISLCLFSSFLTKCELLSLLVMECTGWCEERQKLHVLREYTC